MLWDLLTRYTYTYLAVPTFIGFLQDVESPYEVIIIFYVGVKSNFSVTVGLSMR